METIKLTKGSAVSLDIIGSTKVFTAISAIDKESKNHRIYRIVNRINNAIKHAVGASNGEIVHYTGDGALLFFEDVDEMTSVEQAIRFGLDFSCKWRRWKTIFEDLKKWNLNFRIAIDYGDVVMRDDGGLWSGLVLNQACKIRLKEKDRNRVIITENVKKVLPRASFYEYVFSEVPSNLIGDDCGIGKLYSTGLLNNNYYYRTINSTPSAIPAPENKLNWAVCITGIGKAKYQIELVLKSINLQSYLPEYVVIVCEKDAVNGIKKEDYQFETVLIDKKNLKNTNRSSVRNYLQNYVKLEFEKCEVICFLDGDTVVKQSVFKRAFNIYNTYKDCMISAQRIDFDYQLEMKDALFYSKVFLEFDTIQYKQYSGTISSIYNEPEKKDKKNNISVAKSRKFLSSYLLFVPRHYMDKLLAWDENFEGWGEEDIDYTFRAYKMGCSMIMPLLPDFLTLHLSHEIGDSSSLLTNAQYLLSKYPELKDERTGFYEVLGL